MEADLFKTREKEGAPKFYGLDFFPYPSGAGLSVGHCRNYIPSDVLCRMKIMQGFNVLHPMGFDAFGLPAENEAIKRQSHPAPMIERYADRYRDQMNLVGISFDWSRSFKSSDPSYYRWTQWIFGLLYKRGLAYQKLAAVNWDPVDKTVLADEEVIAGRAERSGALVEKKYIPQWFFKITEYAQRLIDDLDTVDWPEGIKHQQRNWIGRSEGVQFRLKVVFPPAPQDSMDSGGPPEPEPLHPDLAALEQEIRASGFQPEIDPRISLNIRTHEDKLELHAAEASELNLDSFDSAAAKIRAATNDWSFVDQDKKFEFEVFTTRIDTVFGMSFCVLAPEHPLLAEIVKRVPADRQLDVAAYQEQARTISDVDRQAVNREKTGVFTGAYAVNPANGKDVPIWIADYVLATYGTGAIMAVPAHDQRDFDFAIKFGLDVLPVIRPTEEYLKEKGFASVDEYEVKVRETTAVFDSKSSTLINSNSYSGSPVLDAQIKLGEWVESAEIGTRKIQYKLRDWLISRQRYWGCPIPIIYSKEGEQQLAPADTLPIELPWVENYEPSGDGTSPLASIPEFVNVTDLDGRLGRRETDTMGGFACSSWYFLRFCDPFDDEKPWDPAKVAYWGPVDCYVGGAEHAVMHLLYARFWTKVFFDAGLVNFGEPFQALRNQGQVLAQTPYRKPIASEQIRIDEDGILLTFEEAAKAPKEDVYYRWSRMSKSKGNVVTPEEAVETSGADALRLYLLFKAPFEADIEWDNKGMDDLGRFLSRVFRLAQAISEVYDLDWKDTIEFHEPSLRAKSIRRITHQTIRNVTEDIGRFALNTYVSWLMKLVNELNPIILKPRGTEDEHSNFDLSEVCALSEALDSLVLMLAPGAPHCADELWESLGHTNFTLQEPWPFFEDRLAVEDTVKMAVQVGGKLRDVFDVSATASKEEVEKAALALPKVQANIEGKEIRKIIYVPGKLVNIVVG